MHERSEIEHLLRRPQIPPSRGSGLYLMPETEQAQAVYQLAVEPAMWKNDLNGQTSAVAFNSDSRLEDLCYWIITSEIVIADLAASSADLMYVLGLCHGLGRCPILIKHCRQDLPFNLWELRMLEYTDSTASMHALRDELARVIRVRLSLTRNDDV